MGNGEETKNTSQWRAIFTKVNMEEFIPWKFPHHNILNIPQGGRALPILWDHTTTLDGMTMWPELQWEEPRRGRTAEEEVTYSARRIIGSII